MRSFYSIIVIRMLYYEICCQAAFTAYFRNGDELILNGCHQKMLKMVSKQVTAFPGSDTSKTDDWSCLFGGSAFSNAPPPR